jgi:hypothetical protein
MPEAERTPEHEAAIAVLKSYDERFAAILDMIGDHNRLIGEQKGEAQQLLKALKESLKADNKEYYRNRDSLNKYERAFVEPALRKAAANIMSAWNAVPDGRKHSDLSGARMDITHLLFDLERLPVNWSPAS